MTLAMVLVAMIHRSRVLSSSDLERVGDMIKYLGGFFPMGML